MDDDVLRRMDHSLSRIDEHMERGNEHMERGNAHMERGNELMEENRKAFADAAFALRQMSIRNERVMGQMVAELREGRDQMRAMTAATWAMIDRLPPAGGTAAS
jgi:hypothetical protein